MFRCSICGKEYSDKDMNEMRLLNRNTNELETYHVCATCLNNKEDMVAYLADKKQMSSEEARHLYDYFVPLLDDVEADLLRKYLEVRVRSLRAKIAEDVTTNEEQAVAKPTKKKATVYKRLKTALIAFDAVFSVGIFVLLAIISVINPAITAVSIIMGIVLSAAVFVAGYFVIDCYVRMREENYKMLKTLKDEDIEEDAESEEKSKNSKKR